MNRRNFLLYKIKFILLKNLQINKINFINKSIIHNNQIIIETRSIAKYINLQYQTKYYRHICLISKKTRFINKNTHLNRNVINNLSKKELLLNYKSLSW
jgi:hypothetical protein